MYDIDYIAVPIDFSRSSRAALALARNLANKDVHVEAIHVVAPWPSYMEAVLFPYAPLGEDAPEIEHELLAAATDSLHGYHELAEGSEVRVVFGPLKATLMEQIARTPSQLVVAGAFGEGGPMPDSVGAVAHRLVQSANRPVLLVRELSPQVGKILVALDLTEGSEQIFEVAARLALLSGAQLETLHVVPDPLRDDQNKVMGSILKYDRRKTAASARDRVEALFERLFRAVEPRFSDAVDVNQLSRQRRVAIGDPAIAIIERAQELGADLVVVGNQDPARRSGPLGRVAGTVMRRSPTHVCVVPVGERSQANDDD